MTIDNCRCPECGHEFKPSNHCWRVCHQCFQIEEPEDESHKAAGECIMRLGSSYQRYTERDARRYQRKLIARMRPDMSLQEIFGVLTELEEGDEIIFKQYNYGDVFTEFVVTEVDGNAVTVEKERESGQLYLRGSVPMSKLSRHHDRQELRWLEVFE